MEVNIPQIPILRQRGATGQADFLFHNLPNSPLFGSLGTKHYDYNERHIFMNSLLNEIYTLHAAHVQKIYGADADHEQLSHARHLFLTETIVYWMRRNIDEMIGLNYYCYYALKNASEPTKLKISAIAHLLPKKEHALYAVFRQHMAALQRINDISNTYKHSFITSDTHHLYNLQEPAVNCLDMEYNNAKTPLKFHSYFLREILASYIAFFQTSHNTLKQFKWPKPRDVNGQNETD